MRFKQRNVKKIPVRSMIHRTRRVRATHATALETICNDWPEFCRTRDLLRDLFRLRT